MELDHVGAGRRVELDRPVGVVGHGHEHGRHERRRAGDELGSTRGVQLAGGVDGHVDEEAEGVRPGRGGGVPVGLGREAADLHPGHADGAASRMADSVASASPPSMARAAASTPSSREVAWPAT